MTVYELDAAHCRLHIEHIHVEIAGRVSPSTVVAIRPRYAIARLGGAA